MKQLIFPHKIDEPEEDEEEMDLSMMHQRKKVSTETLGLVDDEAAMSDNSTIKEDNAQPIPSPERSKSKSNSEDSEED